MIKGYPRLWIQMRKISNRFRIYLLPFKGGNKRPQIALFQCDRQRTYTQTINRLENRFTHKNRAWKKT